MTKIQKTEDYSSFKRINGNRSINKAQVSKLVASFGERPELASAVPIIVNDKREIIDGQHRFNALKKLGLPVYYFEVEGLNLHDVQIVNSATKTWTPLDYAKSFNDLGNKQYGTYLEFKKKYGISHQILLSYLGNIGENMRGNDNTNATFRAGKFKVVSEKDSHILCQRFTELQKMYKHGDCRAFAIAFKVANANDKYDHKRMVEQIKKFGNKYLTDNRFAEDYMRQLEKIYNFHLGAEKRVRLF